MRKQHRWRMLTAVVLAGVLLFAAGCGGGGDSGGGGGPSGGQKQVIRLGDMQWQSLWINNAIAGFIIEKGYDYRWRPWRSPPRSCSFAGPGRSGRRDGGLDGNMVDWYNEVIEKGQLLDLGKVMDRTTQGWYVPAYVVHGDPERGIEPMAPDLQVGRGPEAVRSAFR